MMNLMKTKDISLIYPHIFNISLWTQQNLKILIYLLGDEKIRKQIKSSISLIKATKVFYCDH
jgi:hypothetical protein